MKVTKVLVVDDDESSREALVALLSSRATWQVQSADTGQEALIQVRNSRFDILVLDILMPGMGGEEFMIEAADYLMATCVIAITGMIDNQLMQRMMNLGATDYILKPITNKKEFLWHVDKAMIRYDKERSQQEVIQDMRLTQQGLENNLASVSKDLKVAANLHQATQEGLVHFMQKS